MKFLTLMWEYKYVVMPVFLWLGVFYDYAHIYLNVEERKYIGVSYGVEMNFSVIYNLLINFTKGVFYGV